MGRVRKQQTQQTSRTTLVAPVSPAPDSVHTSTVQTPALRKEPSPATSPALLPSSLANATWQGLLWTGGRLFGRLLSPQVEWNPAEDGNPASGGELSLHFSRVVPTRPTAVATDVGAHSQQHPLAQREGEALRLPVDKPFTEQSLRVQVFGRQPAGGSFAAPHAFQAEGRDLAAALNVERQWQEYQQRHQTARASAGQPVSKANFAHSSTLAVQSGDGLERLQAIFDVAGGAWLKGIVCRFLVAEASEPQPGTTAPVNGKASCGAGSAERGGAAAAQAGAPAVAAEGMAAPLAVAAEVEHGHSSWLASKPQQRPHDRRQRQQARLQEVQGQRAAEVPETLASLAAAEADSTAQEHPMPPSKDGRIKRSGSRPVGWKSSHCHAGSGSCGELADPLLLDSSGRDCVLEQPMHAALSAAGCRTSSAASGASLSSSASSRAAAAGQPASPQALRRGKAAASPKHAAQPAGEDAFGNHGGKAGGSAAPRSRSRSSGRTQRSGGQEASVVRRHPKLFPGVDQQAPSQPQGTASSVTERSMAHATIAAAPAQPRSGSKQLPASAAGLAGPSHAELGRGQRGAQAAWAEGEPANGGLAAAVPAAAAGGRAMPRPAERSQQQPHARQTHGAQPAAAGFVDLPPSPVAACACGCGFEPNVAGQTKHSSTGSDGPWLAEQILPPATPVWQGAADTADIAAEAAAAAAAQSSGHQPVWQGSADSADVAAEAAASAASCGGSGGSSRPSSPAEGEWSEGSEGSEGSRASQLSWQSSEGIFLPTRPSDWGLSYNYGHPCPLSFTMWEHQTAGVSLPAPVQKPTTPNEAVFWPARRSTGSFALAANGRSAVQAGNGGAGSFFAPPLPLHHASGSMPLLPLPSYHQHSSSSGSQAGGEGGSAMPALVFQPADHHWQAHPLNAWSPTLVPPAHQQPYIQLHVRPVQPSPFMPPMHAVPARPQWAQQQLQAQQRLNGSEPSAEAFWQLHRRSSSIGSGGWQHHAEAALQHKPRMPVHRGAAPHERASAGGGSGHLGSPLPSGSAFTTRSAPASAASSPMPRRAPLRGMPSSTPPPPPLTVPAVDLQVPESAEDGPDLERFLQAATPQVLPPPSGLQDLTMADVWRWYEGPSTVGCEVSIIGGPRGPATAHYLPYLSAVQLFVPATADDEAAMAAAAAATRQPGDVGQAPPQLLSYPNGLDSWPERMRATVQWGEAANMRDRVPLHSRLADLCGDAGEGHPLMAARIADLHPFSWFAVAWYPLYCVPEAPLTARFLTFHTLASLWEAAKEASAKCRQQQEAAMAAVAAEAQRQWLQAAARAAAAAADGQGEAHAVAGATTPRSTARPLPVMHASPGGASPSTALPARPSYKSMLAAGLPASEQPPTRVTVTYTATPTAVCSFPGSPTCSDAGTRTTLDTGSSRAHSVDGGGGSSASAPPRSRLALTSSAGTALPTSSVGGDSSTSGHPASLSASAASSAQPSPPASVVGDGAEPVAVPVAGLAWYAAGRDENWTETLVAAQLPPGTSAPPGTSLASGARLLGSWRGVAVLARPYPVAKGGPLGWEIQQEEMAQCAERLAGGAGLVALRPRRAPAGAASVDRAAADSSVEWDRHGRLPAAALGVSCPDYEFFTARSARYC